MSRLSALIEAALVELEALPPGERGNAKMLEILERLDRQARRLPRPPKPPTAVNRSAQRRLEQLALAPKRR